jgi:hypothetical protein
MRTRHRAFRSISADRQLPPANGDGLTPRDELPHAHDDLDIGAVLGGRLRRGAKGAQVVVLGRAQRGRRRRRLEVRADARGREELHVVVGLQQLGLRAGEQAVEVLAVDERV